jgi:hypothetical protein
MSLRLVFVLVILLSASQDSLAQCCSAGNPDFYSNQANLGHKELQVIAGFQNSLSDQYFSKEKKVDIDFIDKAKFNFLSLQFVYGLSQRITIKTDLGYFLDRSEQYKKADWAPIKGFGLGDAGLSIKYLAYKSFVRKISIIPSVGIKIPIGVFDQEVDHVKLPITVQPSSGSFKYLASIYVSKTLKNNKFNLGFLASVEFPQLINSENFYYKYGNMYLFSVLGSYKLSKNFTLGLEIINKNRAKAQREDKQIVASSGYKLLYAIPHLGFNFAKKFSVSANVDLPVYRYYNGIQLGNAYAFTMRFCYRFSFDRIKKQEVNI